MRFGNGNMSNELSQSSEPMPITCGSHHWAPAVGVPGGYAASRQPTYTGFTTGGGAAPMLPSQGGVQAVQGGVQAAPPGEQTPTTLQSTMFTPGFLRTQIGRRMRVEFLLGSGPLVDRTGTLLSVGASYILIKLVDSDDVMLCDIYSIKFVTILF